MKVSYILIQSHKYKPERYVLHNKSILCSNITTFVFCFFGCFFLFRVNVPIWKRWTGGRREGEESCSLGSEAQNNIFKQTQKHQWTKANVEEGMALYSRCYNLVINNFVPVFPAAESNCRRRLMWRYCTVEFVWICSNCIIVQYP